MKFAVFLALAGLLEAQPPRLPQQGGAGQAGPGRGGRQQQQRQEQEPVKPEDMCLLDGQVVNGATGEPVKKANIVLQRIGGQGEPPGGTASDAAGQFAMKDIAPGRYRMWVERNGFVRQEYGAKTAGRQGATITLEKGQRLKDVVFRLVPQGVIAGRVVDEDGEPLARVMVQASRFTYAQGRKRLTPGGGGAQTNDLGEYRMFGIPPGKYYVNAVYRPQMMMAVVDRTAGDSPSEENYAPTYYPGSQDVTTAVQLEVTAGGMLSGIDIKLMRTRTVKVRGRVIDTIAAGDSRPRTMVQLIPRGNTAGEFMGRGMQPVRDAKGGFEFRAVIPGSYIISAEHFEEGKRFTARMPLDVGNSPIDNVMLTIGPGVELAGQVRLEGETQAELTSVNVVLQVREGGVFMPGAGSSRVKADGQFVLQNVSPDRYNVIVNGMPQGYYLKSIRFGEEDALEDGANLSGGAGGKLDIVISSKGAQLEGVVMNAKQQAAQGASVALVPAETRKLNQLHLFKLVTTDQYGHYTFQGIAPGEYKLLAFEDLENGAHQDPDFIRQYERSGEAVSAKEGSRESKQLKLITPEEAAALSR